MDGYGKSFSKFGDAEIDAICSQSLDSLIEEISRKYVRSRRSKEGADEDIRNYINISINIENTGPTIVNCSNAVGYQNILAIRAWNERGRNYPLIIVHAESQNGRAQQFEREYVDFGEFLEFISQSLEINNREVRRHFEYWKASVNNGRSINYAKAEGIYAANFFQFIENVNIEAPTDVTSIPLQQKPAPIMFSATETTIGLDHSTSHGASVSHVKGSVKALTHQASDVLAIPALDNAAPRSSVRITRIICILERIYSSPQLEMADLIEFGVEFCSFETKMHEAQSRIGELSLGDVIAFLGEGRRFLSRFDSWNEYEFDARKIQRDNKDTTISAIEILTSDSANSMLNEEAKTRVDMHVQKDKDQTHDDNAKEGLSRSAENLAAAAGKAISNSRLIGRDITKSTKEKTTDLIADSASKFISENSSKLIMLAQSRGTKWIEMLIKWFDTQ
jgi:hypothetical protein